MNFVKNKENIVWAFIFVSILGLVYRGWFTLNPIIGGDWPFIFDETLSEFPLIPYPWNTWQANGLGGISQIYFLQIFQNSTTLFTNWLNIPWIIVYKILWFGLFIILSVFSSIYLSKTIFPNSHLWIKLISSIIFVTNTYVLMLADGGQMGVLLAYSLAPLALALFIRLIDSGYRFKSILIFSLSLSAQVMFDPRVAYLTMIAILIYFIFISFFNKSSLFKFLYSIIYAFIIPGIITILIHAVWILPYILSKQNFSTDFGEAYSGIEIVKFLSFASFSQTLSLLHPNWPENIFGKSYFMRSEFLIIPIIVFSPLLFVKKIKDMNKEIVYFFLLALLGAFLAKGSNPPFGEIYLSAFSNIPGFIFFRDSTKFYIFVILAYSILIPYALDKLSSKLFNVRFIIPVLFIIFWIGTINPAILGRFNGTFKNHEVPREYLSLRDFINNQHNFFRTLWIPRQNRFTFYSNAHPSVEAIPLFKASSSAEIIAKLRNEDTISYLRNLSIKYIIVPYDPMGDIFQKDRKYDEESYKNLINDVGKISWLKKVDGFEKIVVFETPEQNDHIKLLNGKAISSKMITPYSYRVAVNLDKPTELIFSENYSPYWIIKENKNIIYSEKTLDNLNSFKLNKAGIYSFEIYFSQERYYVIGKIISVATFMLIACFILLQKNKLLLRN